MLGQTTRFMISHASRNHSEEIEGVTYTHFNVSLVEVDLEDTPVGGETINLNIRRSAAEGGIMVGTVYDATFTEVV